MARLSAAFFLGVFLLIACAPSPKENDIGPAKLPSPETTTAITGTRALATIPSSAPKLDDARSTPLSQPSEKPIVPFVKAPRITFQSWSPDSMWLAYWTFTAEEAHGTYGVPPVDAGQLHFLNVHSGQICSYPDQAGYGAFVIWQTDGSVIVRQYGAAKRGFPCDEAFATSENFSPPPSSNSFLSPGGQYRVDSVMRDQPDGTISVVTRITNTGTGKTENVIEWKHPGGVGAFGDDGEWLSPTQFLIPRTLDQGPLFIEVGSEIVHVARELFNVPPLLDAGVYWQASGAVVTGTNTYHLLLFGSGVEANLPSVRLYHSETGKVETLPFQYVWGKGFSTDGRWLLLEKGPLREGFQGQEVWFRPVDPIESPPRLLARGFALHLRWSSDETKIASTDLHWPRLSASQPSVVQLFSFPEATLIGAWKSEDYTMIPLAWSPNDRFLAIHGFVTRVQREALFVIPVP
jgi:hypothetical protein